MKLFVIGALVYGLLLFGAWMGSADPCKELYGEQWMESSDGGPHTLCEYPGRFTGTAPHPDR
ncbi:MAG TPA: hypothetical protein VHG52_13635 [Thermomicrobiales bacterium]|nr:hypothetical protein [Thermomicrobiales bacterium]